MLIPLKSIHAKYSLNISGIIHVGGHHAEEHGDYTELGVENIVYIEASKKAFNNMNERLWPSTVKILNVALADYEGLAEMNVETSNGGQSNSLLKPGTHTKHYPGIKFTEKETVVVTTMDSLGLSGYNFLNIDVQGAELMVLKGATNYLKGVDYIYTEVNREQVYEGCPMIEEIDAFLSEFKRVETKWTGQGWGDAFYIRKQENKVVIHPKNDNIVSVPSQFREPHPYPYPSDNKMEFERWFHDNVKPDEISGRVYLPIFWTSYYVRNKYGKNKIAISTLQRFLNQLDKRKKYFTICQFDDGILNDLSNFDIKVFGMSGGRIDYPLPLICQPHHFQFDVKKDIFCSFVGAITHVYRRQIINALSHLDGYYITDRKHSMHEYCRILARSKYVLAPRGYGKASFRMQEALQYGATPVYISDEHILPHRREDVSINIKPVQIPDIAVILNNVKPIDSESAFNSYFTYESNKKLILANL